MWSFKGILIVVLACLQIPCVVGQDTTKVAGAHEDSFKRIDVFPAISYSPETKLTLGVIGYYYLNLARADPETNLSNINFLAVYTTAKQTAIESTWDIFTDGNKWRTRGKIFYNKYPDRNYGVGNDASVLVKEYSEDNSIEILNYLPFTYDIFHFSPSVLKRVTPDVYTGLNLEIEHVWNDHPIPEKYQYVNADSSSIMELPVSGLRAGFGIHAIYDTRDFVLNPIKGTFIELKAIQYLKWFGGDYKYHKLTLDVRRYLNTTKNQTLAIRGITNFRFSRDPIPLRGLSRLGGRELLRGFYKGTYQDDHMIAFEVEYRLPFWKEDTESKLWQVWKRLGMVCFVGAGQVFNKTEHFDFKRFNAAAGLGMRILFNPESRVNIRIDYSFALRKDSDGPGKSQSGLYFYLAEAF